MLKLNNKGFSFHIVLPILALLAVGSIGAYMTFKSSAAVPPEGWTTIKSYSLTWTIPNGAGMGASPGITANGKSKYRFCVVVKASSGSTNRLLLKAQNTSNGKILTQSVSGYIGTSNKTVCSSSGVYPYNAYVGPVATKYSGSAGKLYITKVFWQRYY